MKMGTNCPEIPNYILEEIGIAISRLVAVAMRTEEHPLSSEHVEWVPTRMPGGSITPILAFDVEAIGYPDRKAILTNEKLLELKQDILAITLLSNTVRIDPYQPLIWVKWQDPDGLHL